MNVLKGPPTFLKGTHILLLFKRYILVDIRVLMDALFYKVLIISISLYVQESLKKKCALQPGLKLHSPL